MQSKKLREESFGSLLLVSLLLLIVFIVAVIAVYCINFGTQRSPKGEDWASFGSYFGGLVGPAISLVALVAFLKTVTLQMRQNASIAGEGVKASVASYKQSQLNLLDQQITMYERMIDRYDKEGERIFAIFRDTGHSQAKELQVIDSNLQKCEREIGGLIKLSIYVSLTEFESVDQIRIEVKNGLANINGHLYT